MMKKTKDIKYVIKQADEMMYANKKIKGIKNGK